MNSECFSEINNPYKSKLFRLKEKSKGEIDAIKENFLSRTDIVASDRVMLDLLRLLKRLARVDSTILLLGETGVGKEEMAKFVHRNSQRAHSHFIRVNCGAIPHNLIESELFGYEKGSFTGATKEGKIGLFQVAEGGTIFLDEIGDLPLDMQVKLLSVLQEREIIKIGGVNPIKIDVRVLAATNKNLEEMVEKKLFREDLYYRINVVPVTIPPLRERKSDIIMLVSQFLVKLNKKYNMNKYFSEKAINTLTEYSWPGNVRELKNVVERAVFMAETDMIFESDLYIKGSSKVMCDEKDDDDSLNLKEKIEKIEMEYILLYYKKYKNIRRTAAALGMEPSTFVRKRDKYLMKYSGTTNCSEPTMEKSYKDNVLYKLDI